MHGILLCLIFEAAVDVICKSFLVSLITWMVNFFQINAASTSMSILLNETFLHVWEKGLHLEMCSKVWSIAIPLIFLFCAENEFHADLIFIVLNFNGKILLLVLGYTSNSLSQRCDGRRIVHKLESKKCDHERSCTKLKTLRQEGNIL